MLKIILFITATILFFSCGSDSEGNCIQYSNKIDALERKLSEKEQFVNLLNQELGSINTTLDGIDSESSDDTLIGLDPILKIQKFDSLLIEGEKKIDNLSKLVAQRTSNSDARLLNNIIENLRSKLEEKEEEIRILKSKNDSLTIETKMKDVAIESLNDEKSSLVKETEAQKEKLNQINQELFKQKRKFDEQKANLEIELVRTKNEIEIEKGNSYFNVASELLADFDDISAGFLQSGRKKMKRDMIKRSYEYFRKACQLGHPGAPTYIRRILTMEQYNQFLEINRSASGLSKCGI